MSSSKGQELQVSPPVATLQNDAGADIEDPALEQVCLQELDLDLEYPAAFSDREIPWSRKYSCRVHVKRYSKSSTVEIGRAQQEITALLAIQDVSVPRMLDYFDPAKTIYVILQDRDDLPLKQYIEKYGSFPEDLLKSVVTQLFNALAAIFLAGFAHLSIRDESLYIDADGQLTIKDFQHTHKYGTRKEDDIYATTDVRYGKDIWTAPEVLAAGKYNARKAVLWSCGIAIYYMTTGQIEKLTALEHPANPDSRRASVVAASPDPTTTNSEDTSGAPPPMSPRRPSFFSPCRKSSAANNDFQAHARRKSSISTGLATISPIVPYPG